jgi:hypothetical protein
MGRTTSFPAPANLRTASAGWRRSPGGLTGTQSDLKRRDEDDQHGKGYGRLEVYDAQCHCVLHKIPIIYAGLEAYIHTE